MYQKIIYRHNVIWWENDDQVPVVKDLMDQYGNDCTEENAWGSIARACARKQVMNKDIGKVNLSSFGE